MFPFSLSCHFRADIRLALLDTLQSRVVLCSQTFLLHGCRNLSATFRSTLRVFDQKVVRYISESLQNSSQSMPTFYAVFGEYGVSRDFSRSACRETPHDAVRDNQHSSDSRSSSVQCDDSEVCVLSKTLKCSDGSIRCVCDVAMKVSQL